MENNLLNVNGEYVKFYVTTNSNIPYILKNSGSIVIYHDKNNVLSNGLISSSYSLNYIYLGNEIIASGYGLSNIDLRNKSEEIALNYDERQSYIDNKFAYIDNDLDYLHTYTLTYNGNLQHTYISNNDNKISIDDLLFNTVHHKYKEAEILYEKTVITYFTITNPAELYQFYGETALNKDISDISEIHKIISYNNEPIKLPVGAKIDSFTKEFKIKLNDESGIYAENSLSYSYLPQIDCVTTKNFDNIKYNESFVTLKLEESSEYNVYKIIYNYDSIISNPTSNQFYVKDGLTYLASYMNIQTHGTRYDKLSYYTYFDTEKNSKIYSKENAILSHPMSLNPIVIQGCPILYTYQSTSNEEQISFTENGLLFGGYGDRVMLDDITKLNISYNTNVLYFALPINTIIEEIYYLDISSNSKINITGIAVDLNITNPIKKYPYNVNNDIIELPISIIAEYPNYNYKFYMLKYSDFGFINDLEIYIKTTNNTINDIYITNNIIIDYKPTNDITNNIINTYKSKSRNNIANNITNNNITNNITNNNIANNIIYTPKITNIIAPDIFKWTSVQNEDYLLGNWVKCKIENENNTLLNLLGITKKYYTKDDEVFVNPIKNWNRLYDLIYMKDNKYQNMLNNTLNLSVESKVLIIPYEYVNSCQFVLYNYNSTEDNTFITHINNENWEKDLYLFSKLDAQYCKIKSLKYKIKCIICNDYYLNDSKFILNENDIYDKLLESGLVLTNANIYKNTMNDLQEYVYLPYDYKMILTYKKENEIIGINLNHIKSVHIGSKLYNIYAINEYHHIKALLNDTEITVEVLKVKIL